MYHLAPLAVLLLAVVAAAAGPSAYYNDGEFSGKVVLVTGGSSGIGYQTALQFARAGARVVMCSRDRHPTWFNGSTAEKNINSDAEVKAAGGSALWMKADVSDYKQAEAFFNAALAKYGTVDIAINNAGLTGAMGNIDTMAPFLKTENDPLVTNVYGVVNMMVLETQYWVKMKKDGVIVNLGSIESVRGTPSGALYGASKHAVYGLSRSVALEYALGSPKIRVNCIAPGLVATPLMWNQAKMSDPKNPMQPYEGDLITPDSPLWKQVEPSFLVQLPNRQASTPEQQANTILFLSSEKTSYTSGAIFSVDYGLSAL